MMWKAGRQQSPALSTAESELSEAIEGLTMGDGEDVLLQEMVRRSYGRVIKVDNQAAVSLLSEPDQALEVASCPPPLEAFAGRLVDGGGARLRADR